MRTVILVPRRAGVPDRDRLWDWCKARWQRYHPEWAIYEGHHDDGPFNRSAAINTAARLADKDGRWDYGIVIDADIFLRSSQVRKAVETASRTGRVTWAHTRWRGLNEDWTKRLTKPKDPRDLGAEIEDIDMDVLIEKTNPISWSCCIVIPRKVWDSLGGFDERFHGWGFEDHAFRAVVCGLHGHERLSGDVYHLWHDRPLGAGRASKDGTEYSPDAITNARLGRRYMVAVLRDHGIGDQLGQEELTKAEAAVHIANLKKDDAKLSLAASRVGLPDWSKWWPGLEELNEGAKLYAAEQRTGTVTVIVHTGGQAEAWPERREYLRRSVASLDAQVSGPIVKRVIYDCWGDPDIRTQLRAEFGPLGYSVVGPDAPTDYTGSMVSMWRYLSKRSVGEFIFQAEDDFTYDRPVDLVPMIETLRAEPHLVQMALLRDPCYGDERDAAAIGNILGWPRPAFTFQDDWVEHRLFWTANPSLFRKSLTDTPWPIGHHSETLFGRSLGLGPNVRDQGLRSAFWGDGSEWITHIGQVRAGTGY